MDLEKSYHRQCGRYAVAKTSLHITAGMEFHIQIYVHDAGDLCGVVRSPQKLIQYPILLKMVSYRRPGSGVVVDTYN